MAMKSIMPTLKRILSDRNFVRAGFFFGSLNCMFGSLFGPPLHSKWIVFYTFLSGYFLAGFVCGMAVWGIYGVSVSIGAFSRKAKPSFDFTSPDRCGGTVFLGEALVVFSLVTLVVGIMISIYILKAPWSGDSTGWHRALKYLWVVFPYVMSLVALIAPAVAINNELRQYKMEQADVLKKRLAGIRERLEDKRIDAAERKVLHDEYEYQMSVREVLHGMRTWPYGVSTNLTYLAGVVSSAIATVAGVSPWAAKHLHDFIG